MNELGIDAPLIGPVGEGQCLEVIRPNANSGENGSYFSNSGGSSSPESETASQKEDQLIEDHLQSSPSDESFGANNDADESMTETSSSGSSARMEDGALDGGISSGHCFDGWKMVAGVKEIVFHTDFVMYESIYSTNSELIFSDGFLEAKGVATYGDQDIFCVRLRLEDIILIESHWVGRFQTAKVKICATSENEEAETNCPFPRIKKVEFAVTDPCWYEKCEAIRSLDVRYNAVWKVANDTEMEEDEDTLRQKTLPFQTSYFPNFKPFEDFIYPEGDADAVSISKRDVDLLQPDTFVNDTVIDFYIKYLKDKMLPEKRQRFHFFNSFFFRKLADLEKYPSGSFDGRAAFLRVRKWTRKVNLFEKDFIFIPVNHNYHWSLLVICHPGEVVNFRDEDVKKWARVPCILHMDSIRGTHVDLKDRIQSYLCEEWKERQKETSEDISSKFSNLRFVSLELPQQQNSYDCGLFLLHYVEQFLEEDPVNISPFKITPLTQFLSVDWFPSSEPSLKRRDIQKLIYDLLENHSQETSPDCDVDKCQPFNGPKTENAMQFSQAESGLEMTLFPAASLRGSSCANNSGMGSGELFESGSAPASSVNMQYQALNRMASFNEFKNALASIEEDGTGGNIVYSTSIERGFQHLGGMTPETCDYVCTSRDLRNEVSWSGESSIHQNACKISLDSVPVKSVFYSDNSLEVRVDEKCEVAREISLDEKMDLMRPASTGNVPCLTDCFASDPSAMLEVQDAHCSNQALDQNDASYPLKGCPRNPPEVLNLGNGAEGNVGIANSDVDSAPEVEHDAKRQRLMPASEELAKSMSDDLCL